MNHQKLIKKFLSNQCSAQEAAYIEQLLLNQPEILDDFLSEQEWQQHISSYQKPISSKANMLKALAFIFIPLGFVLLDANFLKTKAPSQQISFKTYYHNQSDTIQSYVLADSSTVRLHPAGKIFVQLTSDEPLRYVRVDKGVAKFEVAKNKYRPFVVEGGGLRTTALGTAFTVSVAPELDMSSIHLEEGKVKVEHVFAMNDKTTILLPGQQVDCKTSAHVLPEIKQPQKTIASKVNTPERESLANATYSRPLSIKIVDGSIWITDTPLGEALDFISNELDMPVAYKLQDLARYKVAGRFIIKNSNDPKFKEQLAQDILQLVTEVNPLLLSKQYNTFILRNNN